MAVLETHAKMAATVRLTVSAVTSVNVLPESVEKTAQKVQIYLLVQMIIYKRSLPSEEQVQSHPSP